MLKIKLARFGKRNQPHYRIVVTEARSKRDGKYTALVGHYAPAQSPKVLEINVEAYKDWLTKGAQPTDTVAALFKKYESGSPFPEKKKKPSKKQLVKEAAAKEAKEADQPEVGASEKEAKTQDLASQQDEAPAEETSVEEKKDE